MTSINLTMHAYTRNQKRAPDAAFVHGPQRRNKKKQCGGGSRLDSGTRIKWIRSSLTAKRNRKIVIMEKDGGRDIRPIQVQRLGSRTLDHAPAVLPPTHRPLWKGVSPIAFVFFPWKFGGTHFHDEPTLILLLTLSEIIIIIMMLCSFL